MFIEIVDSLRCVASHEDSWLVAATRRMSGRSIVEGTLGCPVCRRTYVITDGVVRFGGAPDDGVEASASRESGAGAPSEEEVVRLAALLDLTSPGGLVVLAGAWARYGSALAALTGVRVLLLDAPPTAEREGGLGAPDGSVSAVRAPADTVPLAAGAARAVALDAASAASPARVVAAVRALGGGGRIVAPASAMLPEGVRELARDDALWVAAREVAPSASAPIPLRRPHRA